MIKKYEKKTEKTKNIQINSPNKRLKESVYLNNQLLMNSLNLVIILIIFV